MVDLDVPSYNSNETGPRDVSVEGLFHDYLRHHIRMEHAHVPKGASASKLETICCARIDRSTPKAIKTYCMWCGSSILPRDGSANGNIERTGAERKTATAIRNDHHSHRGRRLWRRRWCRRRRRWDRSSSRAGSYWCWGGCMPSWYRRWAWLRR